MCFVVVFKGLIVTGVWFKFVLFVLDFVVGFDWFVWVIGLWCVVVDRFGVSGLMVAVVLLCLRFCW